MDRGLLSARNRREKVNDRQAPYLLGITLWRVGRKDCSHWWPYILGQGFYIVGQEGGTGGEIGGGLYEPGGAVLVLLQPAD
jgi:hypothetical protein